MATIAADMRGDRIITLDIVRGVAVMGILAMNIVAFRLSPQSMARRSPAPARA